MSTFSLPRIRPISDLRTNLNEVESQAKEAREPIIMTKNGVPSLVVIDSDVYEEMLQSQHFVEKLREAEIESRFNSKRYSHEEMKAHSNELLKAAGKLYA